MKTFSICLFVLIITFFTGLVFYSYSPAGIAEAKILGLMDELHQAEQNKDEEKLKQILADEIFWSRYNDRRFAAKTQFIENIKNNEFEIRSIKTSFISTKVEKNQVKVYFIMEIMLVGEDKKPFDHHGNYIYTFEKQKSEWKLAAIHLEN